MRITNTLKWLAPAMLALTFGCVDNSSDDDTTGTGTVGTSPTSSTTDPSTSTTDPSTSTTDPSTSTTDPSTSTGACEPPEGMYGDCINGMAPAACGGSGTCIVDDPMNAMNGVCFIQGCTDTCDCWEKDPTDDSTSEVTCGEIVEGGGTGCFLNCSMGKLCPTGMICFAGTICMWELEAGTTDATTGTTGTGTGTTGG